MFRLENFDFSTTASLFNEIADVLRQRVDKWLSAFELLLKALKLSTNRLAISLGLLAVYGVCFHLGCV